MDPATGLKTSKGKGVIRAGKHYGKKSGLYYGILVDFEASKVA